MERAVLRAGEAVLFYDPPDPYFELSNFWPCRSLVVDGVAWPTTEHLYQASKFADEALRTRVRLLPTPRAAFDFTRDPANAKLVRGDWDDAKVDVMRGALRHKFTQDEALRDLLLATGEAPLVEHSAVDPFWGDGGDGSGRNTSAKTRHNVEEAFNEAVREIDRVAPSSSSPAGESKGHRHGAKSAVARRVRRIRQSGCSLM
eukprot:m51a1_g9289 putative swarming motility protein ybia (202) ;mRNA; r:20537-21323